MRTPKYTNATYDPNRHLRHAQNKCPALVIFIVTVGSRLDRINYPGAAGLLFRQRR